MTTVNKIEIEKFSKLAHDWWNPNGKFKPLHLFNSSRVEYIKEKLISYFKLDANIDQPLKNINILDIGCGGGLLCEPLSRLGAVVTGVDASKKNIEIAKFHASEMNLKINYIHSAPEKLDPKKKFDVILNMEIIEHVANVDLFIENCSTLIKKNGFMFIATINKNLKSYIFAIVGAEYFLRWLPIGTHQWDKFIKPEELEIIANKKNFLMHDVIGMKFNFFSKKWHKSSDSSVNYISTFLKS